MSNTKIHHLTRFGVAANITVVAAFSLLTVFLISHRQDFVSNPEGARNSYIVQEVSLEQALVSVKEVSLEQALVSVKDAEGEITQEL